MMTACFLIQNAKPLTNPVVRLFLIYQSKYWFPWHQDMLGALSCFKYSRDFKHHFSVKRRLLLILDCHKKNAVITNGNQSNKINHDLGLFFAGIILKVTI